MAGITLCNTIGINIHEKCKSCYRNTAKPSEGQKWMQPPILPDGTCSEYWPDDAWQDPKRDRAVAQNGNTGAHYDI